MHSHCSLLDAASRRTPPQSESPSIPVLRTQIDTLRGETTSLKQAALAPHPVEQVQAEHLRNEWESKMFLLERVYGAHAAWEKRMDRAALATTRRLPGVASSHVGIDHLLGRDDKIFFEDYLNREYGARGAAAWPFSIGLGAPPPPEIINMFTPSLLSPHSPEPEMRPRQPVTGVHEAIEKVIRLG